MKLFKSKLDEKYKKQKKGKSNSENTQEEEKREEQRVKKITSYGDIANAQLVKIEKNEINSVKDSYKTFLKELDENIKIPEIFWELFKEDFESFKENHETIKKVIKEYFPLFYTQSLICIFVTRFNGANKALETCDEKTILLRVSITEGALAICYKEKKSVRSMVLKVPYHNTTVEDIKEFISCCAQFEKIYTSKGILSLSDALNISSLNPLETLRFNEDRKLSNPLFGSVIPISLIPERLRLDILLSGQVFSKAIFRDSKPEIKYGEKKFYIKVNTKRAMTLDVVNYQSQNTKVTYSFEIRLGKLIHEDFKGFSSLDELVKHFKQISTLESALPTEVVPQEEDNNNNAVISSSPPSFPPFLQTNQ